MSQPPILRVEAPAANVTGRVRFSFIPDEKRTEMRRQLTCRTILRRLPNDPSATLTVRDRILGQADRRSARDVAL